VVRRRAAAGVRPKPARLAIAAVVVRRKGLFQPAVPELVHSPHHAPHIVHPVANVRVSEEHQIIAECLAHRAHAARCLRRRIADAQLDRLVARIRCSCAPRRSIGRRLVAERDAFCWGWLSRSAQAVCIGEGWAALRVSTSGVDAAHPKTGAAPHARGSRAEAKYILSHTLFIVGVHPRAIASTGSISFDTPCRGHRRLAPADELVGRDFTTRHRAFTAVPWPSARDARGMETVGKA